MKQTNKSWFLILGFCLIAIIAKADIFDEIAIALKSGNASEVSKYFDTSIELRTLGKSNVYSKNQAEMVLKDFFDNNQPKNFTVIHRGASAKGARYAIGNLETAKGTYRTYLYIKDVSGKLYIQELSIEQQ
jgi:hypothetical protein